MKITIESTSKVVDLVVEGRIVPARIWQGTTDTGIPVHCFITRIAPTVPNPSAEVTRDFERELQSCRTPTAELGPIPMRFIL